MVKHGEWCPGGKPRRLLMRGAYRVLSWFRPRMTTAAVLLLTGCTALTTDVLVDETGRPRPAVATHCAGSEWTDNSMIAVVPLPIIGYASPTQQINEIKTDDVLSRCGPPDRLTNRRVGGDPTRTETTPLPSDRQLGPVDEHVDPEELEGPVELRAELLGDADRADVPLLNEVHDVVGPERPVHPVGGGTRRLGRVAAAPARALDGPADLEVRPPFWLPRADAADELAGRLLLDGPERVAAQVPVA